MKLLAIATTAVLSSCVFTSCAGDSRWQISVRSPFGDVNTAPDGAITFAPLPIVIPAK
jgi:hypothetical protein